MKPVIIIAIALFFLIPLSIDNVFAETWYYYVEPLPAWASYANNVMDRSTYAWESVNPDLEFIEVTTPEQANFSVQWVKEFGVEHVGYAYGSWFVEVGLGDSHCGDGKTWQPYSENYVSDIMTHEIGHVLGWDHVDDPNSIMYPTAINWEYGRVEESVTLTNGYGYFLPICTVNDVTTFDWSVTSDDPVYGFDVFFVPSSNEFDNWLAGGSFSYFQDNGCQASNMLSVSGTCKGVTSDSGLLVIMGDTVTNPLTQISIDYQENSPRTDIISDVPIEQTKSQPLPTPVPSDDVNTTFSLFVDPEGKFSMKYPSSWLINNEKLQDFQVGFSDNYDWISQIFVMHYEDIDYTGYSENDILNDVIILEQNYCNNATFKIDGYICYNFETLSSDTTILDSGELTYVFLFTDTRQYDTIQGIEFPTTTFLMDIHDGNSVWSVYSETDSDSVDAYGYSIATSLESFKILQTSDAPSTTNVINSIPLPTIIPTTESNIFSNIGTVTLDKNYVELTYANTEQIKISGNVIDSKKGDRIHITYTYPDGTTNGDLVFMTNSGTFETFLILDNTSPRGTYDILITAKNKIVGNLELIVTDKVHDPQTTLETSQDLNIKSGPTCGAETILKDGMCIVDTTKSTTPKGESSKGGGCLIATATYGSELAPEVQKLRELRDNSLLQTESGTSFISIFNQFYYSFSPVIADYERENPVFKELVKVAITPMITSLSILNYVDMDSESEVLGYGISLIVLNLAMYVGVPIVAIVGIRKKF